MQSTRHDANLAALHASTGLPGQVLDVVVLTADAGVLATLREASAAEHAIWHAESADAAVDLLVGGRCGILVADLGSLSGDASALLDRLHSQFPELILMATGRREEESAVASLVSDGRIYRFLHKPVSPARAGLFIAAATRRYYELRNAEPIALTTVKTIAARPNFGRTAAAVGVAIVALIAFFIWRSNDKPAPVVIPSSAPVMRVPEDQIPALLASAQIAHIGDRLTEPKGDNALEYYRRVLEQKPDHPEALAGVARVVAALETRVSEAIRARNPQQGAMAFAALQRAQPDHPRLAALQSELITLSRSLRTPIVDPAVPAAATATPPAVAANAQRAAVERPASVESDTEQSSSAEAAPAEEIVAEELAIAVRLRERGQLIEPAGNNAYEQLLALRARQPDSQDIRNEQQRLAFALLERARTALAAEEVDRADALLRSAENLVPGMDTTKTLQQQLEMLREQRSFATNIAQAADLKRTRAVPPLYPPKAQADGIEGWVDVEFTIAPDGTTQDFAVRAAQPSEVFEKAAVDSVRRWRFEPIVRNGVAVPQRAVLRVRFVLRN